MTTNRRFPREHFEWMQVGATGSAKEVVPLVREFLQPKSVMDYGCGTGDWLKVFRDHGSETLLGIDGDWVSRDLLKVKQDEFMVHDIRQPLKLNRQFDLAMTVEAVHHVPDENARYAVEALTNHAPVVLFSSSIPHQRQSTSHVNDQWPDYWAGHFADCGFAAVDCIRDRIWGNNKVEWYYSQNMLMFVKEDRLKDYPALEKAYQTTNKELLARIHPKSYLLTVEDRADKLPLMSLLKTLPRTFVKAVKRRLGTKPNYGD